MAKKCPKCGAEYYSSAPTCYSCSQLDRPPMGDQYLGRRRIVALLVGASLSAVGLALTLRTTDIVPEDGWKGFASFGVFVISLGAGIISYSLLNKPTSLKEFREGTEPNSPASAGLAALGCGIMVFVTGYLNAALHLGFSSRFYEVLGILLPLSIVLIVVGLLKLPGFLIKENETEMSVSVRSTIGFSILLVGFIVQVVLLGYGYWASPGAVLVGWMWFLLIGPFFVIAGLAILWGPMGRPWIPGGYGKEAGDDGRN